MRGFAALALVAGFSSCVKDVDGTSQKEIDDRSKENAEMQLGISIPDGQTWDMASQVEANVTVNGDYGAKYTVSIYENNPFINNTAVVLGKAETVSGGTASTSFTCPDATKSVFVAIKDEKGYSYVKPAAVVDGKIETTFGGEAAAGARSMRALTQNAADNFVIPVYTQPTVSQYLDGAREINTHNAANDFPYSDLSDEEKALVPEEDKIQMDGWIKISQKKLKLTHDWNAAISALGLTDTDNNKGARTLYIENATWNVPENTYLQVGQGTVIVVGANGHITIPASATIKFTGNSNYNCQLIVLPTGSITGEGTLEFSNGSLTGKYDYNAGTINVGKLNNNGGEFYNAGIVRATVLAGGAGLSTYINAGKFYITRSDYGSGSSNTRLLNNCWFEAEENLFLRNLVQGAGAYVKVGTNFEMSCGNDGTSDPSYIYAKANSMLDVRGAAGFNNVDVVGPTEGYAYMQFGWIENAYGTHQLHFDTNYTGWPDITCGAIINNIRLSVDNVQNYGACGKVINEMMNGSAGQNKTIGNGNAILAKKLVIDTTVEPADDDCAPTFKEEPPTPIYEKLKVYTYAFEDQTVGTDYDMNDVVLKVSYKVKSTNSDGEVEYDKTKLDATLVAAGATYNIKIKIGDTYLFEGQEIHDVLGVNAGVMVNTGNGKAVIATPQSDLGIVIPSGWNGDFTTLPVTIEVTSTGKNYSYPNTDPYPHAVMIPVDWAWPTERTIVTKAYPGTEDAAKVTIDGVNYPVNSFDAWAATPAAQRTADMDWYNHPDDGLTMKNN